MTKTPVDPSLRAAGLESKAWPFEEARKLLKRVEQKKTRHDYILFETGYGPVRPAAHRHLRRGGAHHHDPPCLRDHL
jgi:hypothetical protein